MSERKPCKTCGRPKVLDDFYTVASGKNGKLYRSGSCKACKTRAKRLKLERKPAGPITLTGSAAWMTRRI